VIDNCPGFDQQTIQDIEAKIQQIDESGLLPSLEIKGMGAHEYLYQVENIE